jgi:hypothetical protein
MSADLMEELVKDGKDVLELCITHKVINAFS